MLGFCSLAEVPLCTRAPTIYTADMESAAYTDAYAIAMHVVFQPGMASGAAAAGAATVNRIIYQAGEADALSAILSAEFVVANSAQADAFSGASGEFFRVVMMEGTASATSGASAEMELLWVRPSDDVQEVWTPAAEDASIWTEQSGSDTVWTLRP